MRRGERLISARGFTLIELLVVLAVLAVLAAIVTPLYLDRVEDARETVLRQNLVGLRQTIDQFHRDKGRYPLTEALAVASRSALDARLRQSLEQALGRIAHGSAVAPALADAGLCDEVGRRLMAAAERNGEFHLAADVVSRLHGERFELFVERLTRIVEPVLLMAVALMVGTIVVMMYLPVFDMATRLR